MDVEIDDRRTLDAVFALGMTRGNGGVIEKAKPHRSADFGVMARRADGDEGIIMGS